MIRLRQINVKIDAKDDDILKVCSKKLKINKEEIKKYKIVKQSIDARNKEKIMYSYEIDVEVEIF